MYGRTREDDYAAQWQPLGQEPSGPLVSVADGLPVWCLHLLDLALHANKPLAQKITIIVYIKTSKKYKHNCKVIKKPPPPGLFFILLKNKFEVIFRVYISFLVAALHAQRADVSSRFMSDNKIFKNPTTLTEMALFRSAKLFLNLKKRALSTAYCLLPKIFIKIMNNLKYKFGPFEHIIYYNLSLTFIHLFRMSLEPKPTHQLQGRQH